MEKRVKAINAIIAERVNQEQKWGIDKPQSLPGFLLVMQLELQEAINGWMKNIEGKHSALAEIVQVCAVGVACLEKYGISGSAISTDDQIKTDEKGAA